MTPRLLNLILQSQYLSKIIPICLSDSIVVSQLLASLLSFCPMIHTVWKCYTWEDLIQNNISSYQTTQLSTLILRKYCCVFFFYFLDITDLNVSLLCIQIFVFSWSLKSPSPLEGMRLSFCSTANWHWAEWRPLEVSQCQWHQCAWWELWAQMLMFFELRV